MSLPADQEVIGGIVINPASELGKELLKHEQHLTHVIPRGKSPGNPYAYRPYPRMLYKASKRNGKVLCGDLPLDYATDREQAEAARFTRSCQLTVQSEDEERTAMNAGWCETPDAAIADIERREQARGNASAEVNYSAQRMTATAQRELAEAGAQTHEHVVDVQPSKKGVRAI